MEVNLVGEAIRFMFLGMGIVFLFLVMMIYILKLQTYLVAKFIPEKQKTVAINEWKPTTTVVTSETQITAAIIAAIQHHKNNKA